MKTSLSLLRSIGLLLLCLSTSLAEAKECIGNIIVSVKHADGSLSILDWVEPLNLVDISVSLSPGDTVILSESRTGNCYGQGGLRMTGTTLSDTADYISPVVNGHNPFPMGIKIAQRGSYYVDEVNVDFGAMVRLFIDVPQEPHPVGLIFTTPYGNYVGSVGAGDTCSGPCFTKNLADGQFVRMQPMYDGLAQEGGNVVVRYAAEGEPLTFDSPATTIPMIGFDGYQFSSDGTYLLSVEGPMFMATGYAFVEITHIPPPRVDMSLTIERADGSEEEVSYIQPFTSLSNSSIDLAPGDSLRIDHEVITATCESVRLKTYERPDWLPASPADPLIVDTPSTSAGIRMAAPGSYYLQHISDCGIPTAWTRLTINAPTPQLDLVISIRRSDGAVDELFRNDTTINPTPHLETTLNPGDSIHVYSEMTGFCSYPANLFVLVNYGPEDATIMDPHLNGISAVHEITFSGTANYLIRLFGGLCYSNQDVHLHIIDPPVPHIDLEVDQLHMDGTSQMLAYAQAGGPVPFVDVQLLTDDSIRVRRFVEQAPCSGLVLKGYRSEGDTANTTDPVFMDSPFDTSALYFRETGSLLFTLEDTCGALTASAHLLVSEALTTGITTPSDAGLHAYYANELLRMDTDTGGLLEIRNVAGQVVRAAQLVQGAQHLVLPFSGQANGVYIATLRSTSQVEVMRFVVY